MGMDNFGINLESKIDMGTNQQAFSKIIELLTQMAVVTK
jgi:hypothetical protein